MNTRENSRHSHDFSSHDAQNERKTLNVVLLTTGMMIFEIVGGWIFGSMALQADGWHMGTHAAALGMALFAYRYARKHANNPRYTFGTGKVSVLGGYSSAIVLQMIAVLMAVQSGQRLLDPQPIRYGEAIAVAVVGLLVNLISVRLLGDSGHSHGGGTHDDHKVHDDHGAHDDHDEHDHPEHDHHEHEKHDAHGSDHNMKAAYFHVLADAMTSVLAIAALICGQFFGWNWMDALMGIVGGLLITRWAVGLLRETSQILLDGSPDEAMDQQIRAALASDASLRVSDLHVWRVGERSWAAALVLTSPNPRPLAVYRQQLAAIHGLAHLTIEIETPTGLGGETSASSGETSASSGDMEPHHDH